MKRHKQISSINLTVHSTYMGLPLWLSYKASRICLQCERSGFNHWLGMTPWRREWLPTPVFWPGEFQGLYSPWGCKGQYMTEHLSLHFTSLQHRRNKESVNLKCGQQNLSILKHKKKNTNGGESPGLSIPEVCNNV